jgi:hypothetical protein
MKKIFLLSIILFLSVCICSANVVVVGALSIEKKVVPGEELKGFLTIRNDANDVSEARVFQTDYIFKYTGDAAYDKPGKNPRSNTSWITLNQEYVKLGPMENSQITYTVKVPDDPKLSGSYWSLIMIEPIEKTIKDAPKKDSKKIGLSINTVVRFGFQLTTTISDTGEKKLKITGKNVMTRDNKNYLEMDVENTGTLSIVPHPYAELFDQNEKFMGRFAGKARRIQPGCSVKFEIELPVPAGSYKTLVVLDDQEDAVFGAEYTLDIK